jgi:phosphate starvation-inducible PhoH-like protein
MDRKEITIERVDLLMALAGNLNDNFTYLESLLNINIHINRDKLLIEGEESSLGKRVLEYLIECLLSDESISLHKIDYAVQEYRLNESKDLSKLYKKIITITQNGGSITPKTFGQLDYLNLIESKALVFGLGPAGTGKTFLAVAAGIRALRDKKVNKIIVTRPAIEAGENLGYLPGGLEMKIEPYLKPVYESMIEILGFDTFQNYREKGWIEIAPLAYMRGRTLNNAFIILDEAQNTTPLQMKMFLTRFGQGSKVVINGDVTQMDLDGKHDSGLKHAMNVLKSLEEIGTIELHKEDVIRHGLVKKIIDCYENYKE